MRPARLSPNPPSAGSSFNAGEDNSYLKGTGRSFASQPVGSIGCRHAALCGPILCAVIFVFIAASAVVGEDELPKRVGFERYQLMLKQPLFAVATAAAPMPTATPNFAKDLYVANAAHLPDGDTVTIASSADPNFKKYLSTKAPVDGYGIASIEWSEKVGATKVTISKDGQFATLTFNEALLSQRPSTPGVPAPVPNVPMPNVPQPAQPNLPGRTRTPHIRGMIPRYPTPATRPNAVPPSEQ
ncbi:MAG TPA: hypothetical protein VFO30_08460 [Chthoniobacterales bacterium]|nr:hypothetical protein [Chthoniobacterales bacterium]